MKSSLLNSYPELQGRSREEKDLLLSTARYNAFRIQGNNAKLVLAVIPIVVIGILAKLYLHVALAKYIGDLVAGFVSTSIVILVGYSVLQRVYLSIINPELEKLLHDRPAT